MRKLLMLAIAGTIGATTVVATPAAAQRGYGYGYGHYNNDYRRDVWRARAECRRDLRHARNRWEYQRELRDCRRDLREARRDYYRDRRYRRY
jgi:hypothetical protein